MHGSYPPTGLASQACETLCMYQLPASSVACRMGAPDFIRLWAKCGGWFNIQCTTNEAARDLPGRDETAAEDIDLIDRPMEPTEVRELT